jgi:hypothetical protein
MNASLLQNRAHAIGIGDILGAAKREEIVSHILLLDDPADRL